MGKITSGALVVFLGLFVLILILGIGTTSFVLGKLPLGDFRGIALVAAAIVFSYLYAFVVFVTFCHTVILISPIRIGKVHHGSRDQFFAHIYYLFYLLIFNPIIRSNVIPIPLIRLVYIALGARLGSNTYSAGVLLDPPKISVGDNCIIGHNAVLFAHVIENDYFAIHRISIGNNVTIGAMTVVMPDVTIGDNAMVAAGSVVTKGTHIGESEVWGGVPAKLLRKR